MRVLVTRPGEDGATLAQQLSAIGCDPVSEPMLSIRFDDTAELDLKGAQAIVLTSANGARALARRDPPKTLSVFAVGDATGSAALSAGFEDVHSAGGDVEDLAGLIRGKLKSEDGAILHVAGTDVAGDLGGELEQAGFTYRRAVLYTAEPVRGLSPGTVAAIKDGSIAAVVLYSPRTAQVFADLIRKARLVRACRGLTAFCLSPAVAEKASDIAWKDLRVAAHPTQSALLDLVRDHVALEAGAAQLQQQADNPPPQTDAGAPVPPPPPSPRRRMGLFARTVIYVASVIVILAAVGATSPLWIDDARKVVPWLLVGDETEDQLHTLAARVAQLEAEAARSDTPEMQKLEEERAKLQAELESTLKRLGEVEAAVGSVRDMVGNLNTELGTGNGDDGRLQELSTRLKQLEDTATGEVERTGEKLSRLTTQIAELEKKVPISPAEDRRARAAILAISQLRGALSDGRPFTDDLVALKIMVGDEAALKPNIAALEPLASEGVPTLAKLRAEFDELAGQIVHANLVGKEGSWLDRTIDRLISPIRWRRTDNLVGMTPEAIVARAEVRLDAGDVAGAIDELRALEGAPAEVAAPWIGDARIRVVAERAVAELQTFAVSRLSGAAE